VGQAGLLAATLFLDEPAEGTNLRQKGLELAFEEDDDVKERCVEVRRARRERGSSLRRYEGMFAEGTDWQVGWMEKVLPNIFSITAADPERTKSERVGFTLQNHLMSNQPGTRLHSHSTTV
jgi:hypothetical protein